MKISVKMHTWEKILGWLLLVLHVLALPILIELFCVLLSIDLDNGMFNIVFFVLSFLLTVAFFGRFLWKNFQNFKSDWRASFYAALGGFGIYYVLNIFVSILIVNLMPDYSNVNDANIDQITQVYYLKFARALTLLI